MTDLSMIHFIIQKRKDPVRAYRFKSSKALFYELKERAKHTDWNVWSVVNDGGSYRLVK